MKRIERSITLVLVIALVAGLGLVAAPAPAQEDGFTEGRFVLGFRDVDVDGRVNKYREDVNLEDGPRLMDLDFTFTPDGTLGDFVDRIQLDVDNLGSDPFETIRLSVENFGRFDFEYNRTESDYFYNDQLFPPEEVSVRNARAGDFHTFDFERVRDRADLDITLSPQAELTFGFDRYTRRGESTTTLDISRDEFELDAPIDEEYFEYRVGFQYSWDAVTLILDERYTEYENGVELFLPGRSLGEAPDDATILDFFFLDQPYDFESWDHTVRVIATPNDRFTIAASGTIQELDLDVRADERSQGVDFRGNPFTTDLEGDGRIDRDAELFDVDLTWMLTDRWALVGGYYFRSLDQEGDFLFGGDLNQGVWDIETDGVEAGVQWTATTELTLTAGVRVETRDVTSSIGAEGDPLELVEDVSTDHDGYFFTAGWRPATNLRFTFDFDESSIDDPFTSASPTDRTRIRATGRYNNDNGFWLNGSYQTSEYENDNSGWDSNHDYGTLRAGWRLDRFDAQVGYSVIEIDRSIFQTLIGSFGPPSAVDIDYVLDSDVFDALARWRATESLWLGGELRVFENDGSFGVERDDFGVFGEYHFAGGYLARLGFRTVDYDEAEFDFDDYEADIVDVGVGLTW